MRPTTRQLAWALWEIGRLLDVEQADYCWEGRFRFRLDDDWSLVISTDDAERFRLEACYRSRVGRTIWCHATDRARLRGLVIGAAHETAALAAA